MKLQFNKFRGNILPLTALIFASVFTLVYSSIIESSQNNSTVFNSAAVEVYLPSNCSTCSPKYRNEARERRIAEFKNEILTKLGLKSEPKVNMMKAKNLPSINDIIGTLGIYTGINNNNEDDEMTFDVSNDGEEEEGDGDDSAAGDYEEFYVNTKRSITFAQKGEFDLKKLFKQVVSFVIVLFVLARGHKNNLR